MISGVGTNYDLSLPFPMVNYPGPSKTTTFLSSCLWFNNEGIQNTTLTFFTYDTLNKFAFGVHSGTLFVSTINNFSSNRYVYHLTK